MFERIGLATMIYHGERAKISTVKLSDTEYETMAFYDDGEDFDVTVTDNLKDAKAAHNAMVNKYNDLIYEGSINKLIGAINYGQFVTVVKAC